ncbi:MAG: trypsin-like peptidase domain-containing protein [Actinomycetota bacterium]|nr:trypsin-like peptidase domain-containing protein [Actinomycetota bacterium]
MVDVPGTDGGAPRSVERSSIEVGSTRPRPDSTPRSASGPLEEPSESTSFPGLLPAPVRPIDPPVAISGRLVAGVAGLAAVVVALVVGLLGGWLLRGDGGVDSAEGLSQAEVLSLMDELNEGSSSVAADQIRALVDAAVADALSGSEAGLSRSEVEALVASGIDDLPDPGEVGLSAEEVTAIVSSVVDEVSGLGTSEVEALVGRLVEEASGLDATEVEALVARLFADAPVSDSGDEPVVAVAEALRDTVVLVSVPDQGHGSGIVLDRGRIVTNAHVVDGADEVVVSLPNGREVLAEIVGVDVRRDVAVLDLAEEVNGLVPAVFAFSEDLRVGQLAVALGSPFDLDRTVTSGIVSALGRVIDSYGCENGPGADCAGVAMIQTDAPINPGNSGGPLADRQGRVIGMNTSIRSGGVFAGGNIGLGFAIPSDTVVLVAQRLIEGEPVGTAWLGIRGQSPTDGSLGALVVEVVEGSPADAAGLQLDDRIFRSDGRPIRDMPALRADIQIRLPGSSVTLEVDRGGEILRLEVNLGAFDDQFVEPPSADDEDSDDPLDDDTGDGE